MVKLLIISVTQHTPQNKVIDTITHVTLTTTNGVVKPHLPQKQKQPIFFLNQTLSLHS